MKRRNPLVSVCIPMYNAGGSIERCLRSVIGQTYDRIEIICSDDMSDDDTLRIATDMLSEERRRSCVVIANTENVGVGANRKIAVEAATGEYIITLDSDDYYLPDYIEALVEKALESDADVTTGGVSFLNFDGSVESVHYGNSVIQGEEKLTRYWGTKTLFLNNRLIRRDLWQKVDYKPRRFCEDVPVAAKLLFFANKVAFVPNVGYQYVQNEASLTHTVLSGDLHYALSHCLCSIDLYQFFKEQNASVNLRETMANTITRWLQELGKVKPSIEDIVANQNDWNEVTQYMVNNLK